VLESRGRRASSLLAGIALLACGAMSACGGGPQSARSSAPARTSAPAASTGSPKPAVDVAKIVAGMSTEEKVGQLFVTRVIGTKAGAGTAEAIRKYHLGGVIYFPENLKSPAQIADLSNGLQDAARGSGGKVPLLIATDQEGGLVARLDGIITDFPGNMPLGATRSTKDARDAARVTATELRALGLNFDYAPDSDVNINPANPVIGIRSFGADPGLVSRLAGAAIDGYQKSGVAASAKHFPGHGDTDVDSHTGLPVITHSKKEWERVDAPPFRAAIRHHVDVIMTAHVVMPKLDPSRTPATLSKKILTGLLRDELHYDGVVTTDGLEMAGVREKYGDAQVAIRAIKAGADQLLLPPNLSTQYNAVLGAVKKGEISKKRLNEAVTRIVKLKASRGLFTAAPASAKKAASKVRTSANQAVARRVADHSVTLVKKSGSVPLHGSVFVTGVTTDALAGGLRDHGVKNVTASATGTSPSASAISAAASRAKAADAAVVTTDGARISTAQRNLVAAIRRTGRPVAVVAVGTPYDISAMPDVPTYIATYSREAASLRAAAKILTGDLLPTGKLPVSIPKQGGGTLYKIGHGLS
jgi:beta-N-acetylhexosaminidase